MNKKIAYKASAALATVALGVGVGSSSMLAMAAENSTSTQNTKPSIMQWVGKNKMGKHGAEKFGRGMTGGMGGFVNLENTSVTSEKISNGVKETVVGSTAEAIKNIQTVADKLKVKQLNYTKMHTSNSDKDKAWKMNVTTTVEKTDQGAVITRTSTDNETIARLHNQADIHSVMQKLRAENVDIAAAITRTVTETANGVQINVSSDNASVQQ